MPFHLLHTIPTAILPEQGSVQQRLGWMVNHEQSMDSHLWITTCNIRMKTLHAGALGEPKKTLLWQHPPLIPAAFQACWRLWRLSTIGRRKGDLTLNRQAIARVRNHPFTPQSIIRLRLNQERFVMADKHWHRRCQQAYFGAWTWLVPQWRLPPKEEKLLTTEATKH